MDVSKSIRLSLAGGLALSLLFTISCSSSSPGGSVTQFSGNCPPSTVVPDEYLVQWKNGRVTLEKYKEEKKFLQGFVKDHEDQIVRVERNHRFYIPNQEEFPSTKNLNETLESKPNWGAQSIEAAAAWSQGYLGQDILVAVIDNGVNIHHPLLKNQIYLNPGESGLDKNGEDKRTNLIDDDGNGFVDDFSGFNFVTHSPFNHVESGTDHGTHVTGIIAAKHSEVDYDDETVQGVAPGVKILPIDFIDSGSGGTFAQAIESIDYAVQMGAKVINASWGGSNCSLALHDKIQSLYDKGVLFVAAAGNSSNDIDNPRYFEFPAVYQLPSQITVGAYALEIIALEKDKTIKKPLPSNFTNYGEQRVHLFAPGTNIHSTFYNGQSALSGTSMAAPFVTGALATLWSAKPEASIEEIKTALFQGVEVRPDFINQTHGQLNLKRSLEVLLNHPLP